MYQVRRERKIIEAKEEELKQRITSLLSELNLNEVAFSNAEGQFKLFLSQREREYLDKKKLLEIAPEVYTKIRKVTNYQVIEIRQI